MDIDAIEIRIEALERTISSLLDLLQSLGNREGRAEGAAAVTTQPGCYINWDDNQHERIPLMSFVAYEELKQAVYMAWKFNFMKASGRKSIKKGFVKIKKHTVDKHRRFPGDYDTYLIFSSDTNSDIWKHVMDILIVCDWDEASFQDINGAKQCYYDLLIMLQNNIASDRRGNISTCCRQQFESCHDLKWSIGG